MKIGFDSHDMATIKGIFYIPYHHIMVRYEYNLAEKSIIFKTYPKRLIKDALDEMEMYLYDVSMKREAEFLRMVFIALKGKSNEID